MYVIIMYISVAEISAGVEFLRPMVKIHQLVKSLDRLVINEY